MLNTYKIKKIYKSRKQLKRDNKKIQKINKILSDKKSITVFKLLLKAYTSVFRDPKHYYNLVKEQDCNITHFTTDSGYQVCGRKNQYFLHEIFNFEKENVLLDAGAYIGDTANEFLIQTNGNIRSIYCFEPDSTNFKKLQLYISNSPYRELIHTYNVGLDNKDGYEQFLSKDSGSRINKDGDKVIKVVDSQKFIYSHITDKITFIKLDIEGKEIDVLKSMREYIAKYEPDLAISIYHSFTDLWEIPLLIKDINPKYSLYIRHNSNYFTETICYAKILNRDEL